MLCVYLKAGKPEKKDCVFKNSFRVGRKYPEIIDVHCAVLSPSAELLLFMHCAWAVPVSAALFPIPHTCQGCCHAQPHPGPRPAKHRCLLFIIIYFYYLLLFLIIFIMFIIYFRVRTRKMKNWLMVIGALVRWAISFSIAWCVSASAKKTIVYSPIFFLFFSSFLCFSSYV